MFYLIYVSSATRPLRGGQLEDIVRASREANAQIEVTGMLLYKAGGFMQLLEGEEKTVRALLDKIMRDPRHYGLLTLHEGENPARMFPDWSMGFQLLDGDTAGNVPGYIEFESAPFDGSEFHNDPTNSLKLLRLFREGA